MSSLISTSANQTVSLVIKSKEEIEWYISTLLFDDPSPDEGSIGMLTNILNTIMNNSNGSEITVVIQYGHVDRVYRDCYYNHFAGKHFETDRYCKRLFIFLGNIQPHISKQNIVELEHNLVGTIVIKPLIKGAIGRTLLNPHYLLPKGSYQCRTSRYKASLFGKKFEIKAFPFSMQDKETLTCAEITILNMMDYYSNSFCDYGYILPSDIREVMNRNGFERALPAHGMSYQMISKALFEFGFFPRLYLLTDKITSFKMKRLLHYYIESGIPVALGIETEESGLHSILAIGCIGYTSERLKDLSAISFNEKHSEKYGPKQSDRRLYICDVADYCNEYVVMDDNSKPYSIYEYRKALPLSDYVITDKQYTSGDVKGHVIKDAKVKSLAVPLYKRMSLEALDAKDICQKFLSDDAVLLGQIYESSRAKGLEFGTRNNPVIIRLFLASSSTYFEDRLENLKNGVGLRQAYYKTHMPRFIWVCEILDRESLSAGKIIGEIVLDATANTTDNTSAIILFRFFDRIMIRDRSGSSNQDHVMKNAVASSAEYVSLNEMNLYRLLDWDFVDMFSSNIRSYEILT